MKRILAETILDNKYALIQSSTCPFCFKVNLRVLNRQFRESYDTKANTCLHLRRFEYNFYFSRMEAIFSELEEKIASLLADIDLPEIKGDEK